MKWVLRILFWSVNLLTFSFYLIDVAVLYIPKDKIITFRTQKLEYTKKCGDSWKTESRQCLYPLTKTA